MKKSQKHASLAQQPGLDSMFAQLARVGKGHNKAYHLSKKS
jgi:hypothetical protein